MNKNMDFAKIYKTGVAHFFTDGNCLPDTVQITNIEKIEYFE